MSGDAVKPVTTGGSAADRAAELFKSGMNCSQAVFCAFADEFGMDAETAALIYGDLLNPGEDPQIQAAIDYLRNR